MRQVEIDRFGGPEELRLGEGPVPEPGVGEVLVKVAYAGTNPIDYKIREGSSGWCPNVKSFPFVLGREASGEVAALGEGVEGFAVGDRVFAVTMMNHPGRCYAEYVTIPASSLAHSPEGVDDSVLGGLALVGTTAWVAVHDLAQVKAGEKVLVHGGAGGVGQVMVQLCRDAGCEVWATASTRNQERLRELGAHPVDYTSQDFTEVTPKMDAIIDGVYFNTFEPSLDHLVEGGRIVVLPTLADLTSAEERGVPASVPTIREMPENLADLAGRIAAGRFDFEVSQVLPLEQAAVAHRELASGHTRGKIVLAI